MISYAHQGTFLLACLLIDFFSLSTSQDRISQPYILQRIMSLHVIVLNSLLVVWTAFINLSQQFWNISLLLDILFTPVSSPMFSSEWVTFTPKPLLDLSAILFIGQSTKAINCTSEPLPSGPISEDLSEQNRWVMVSFLPSYLLRSLQFLLFTFFLMQNAGFNMPLS